MNGNKEINNLWENRIDNIIKNSGISFMEGYHNYIIKRSITTRYQYLRTIMRFMEYTKKKPEDLNATDYLNYMGTISNKTSNYQIPVYAALKKLSKYLDMAEINHRDPMKDIEAPQNIDSIETETKRERGYLTDSESRKYIQNVKECNTGKQKLFRKQVSRDLAIISLFFNTGMRCSALLRLDMDSFDFDRNILRTVEKERRVVEIPFSKETAEVLQDWIKDRAEMLGDTEVDAFFISNRKKRISQHAVADIIKKYAYDIKGNELSPHKLRATYGTKLYNETHDLYFVQKCMGHSSPSTTKTYIRGDKEESKLQASEIMSKMIF